MLNLTLLITPIFLIILTGYLLKQYLISDDDVWNNINRLAYWVLFPCLLFNKTSVINFSEFSFGPLSIALIAGVSLAILGAYIFGKLAGLGTPALTSVMQGGGRHNAFLALAIVSQLYGDEGELIGAIVIAVLVTYTNIVINVSLTVMLSSKKSGLSMILSDLKRNPFIIAILLGVIFNLLGLGNLPILHQFTQSVGQTTLTVALLCVGAGLRIREPGEKILPSVVIACTAKFIIYPMTVYLLAKYFALPHTVTMVATIFALTPTGTASYPLAKQMGGDAPLMASLISLQTLLSVPIIPVMIIWLS
ncbi:MAG: AEC family transporter [Alphaproteobacteria bacterium]|nr:AEC family transporter [Alphaproteobacteria bacterium]